MGDIILKVNHLTKTYPGVTALDDVSFDLRLGEVHALVGENGAGKSTLVKCLSGATVPNDGDMIVSGTPYKGMDPILSRQLKIEVIYQEFNLVSALSVADNLFLGSYLKKGVFLQKRQMEQLAREVFADMQIDIDPRTKVENLSVGYMQMVEIAKALIRDANILILDEPTAALTLHEVDVLFRLIRRLKAKGVSIIYISHRLSEVFDVCDRVSILRNGKMVNTKETKDTDRQELINLMVGRTTLEQFPKRMSYSGKEIMRVERLSGKGAHDISFALHSGEILGFAGLIGSGRTEAVRMIFGADHKTGGDVYINGIKQSIKTPSAAVSCGIALVPEDRKQQGLILNQTVRFNISLAILRHISKLAFVKTKQESKIVQRQTDALRIKTPSDSQLVLNLSGGNQQKIVLSKWLASKAKILILDEPTRGIDVGAKQEIYSIMDNLSQQGFAIIMISSEMDELIGMSDRILVMHEGRMAGILERDAFSQEHILTLASGLQLKGNSR